MMCQGKATLGGRKDEGGGLWDSRRNQHTVWRLTREDFRRVAYGSKEEGRLKMTWLEQPGGGCGTYLMWGLMSDAEKAK